ncbi:MAG TPA: AAC(3) family N-acetyltransferase, partial [bacterium]|nr:AAC(3) family N-acetyltransferase [bacterium]HEX67879.1 AAC(3) family N-acetyltransferase [bacterium]
KFFKYETGKTLEEKEVSYLIRYLNLLNKYGYIKIHYKVSLTKEDIKKGLRKLGIRKGDRIMVHSSLSSFGYVKGGAKTVIKALMEVVTKKGVLMMPSFNHYNVFKEGGPGYYSPKETPTTNGKIPDTFWRMKGVYRSLNPSHPFAVWGRNAKSYVKNHHKVLTMGENSPLHLLEKEGGKVILIDCPNANTFHHVVEMTNNVPCLGKRTEEYPVKLPNGRMVRCRTWGWRNGSCPITDKGIYIEEMKRRGLIKEGKIGNAEVLVFKMKDCRKVIEEFLKGKIKGIPGCRSCNIRPRTVKATVESDWDDEKKRVKPDTTAFIGDIDF